MNETPRHYAQKIIEWVEKTIAEKVPEDFRALVRATVAAQLAKRITEIDK